MFIHRAIQAMEELNRISTVIIIRLNDHSHVTNPQMTHENLVRMSANIIGHFRSPDGIGIGEMDQPNMAMRADQQHFTQILQSMRQFQCLAQIDLTSDNILAFTVSIAVVQNGPFKVVDFEYNVICNT